MKRVSIGFIIFNILLYVGVCITGSPVRVELHIPKTVGVIILFLWLFFLIGFPLIYPKRIEKRLTKLAEKKNINGIGFRGDFFIPEAYYIDTTNGYLIGLALLNPFKMQYMDLKNVEDVELVTKVFNHTVIASTRCRLHMGKKKYDIWLYRDARYQPTLDVGSEKEQMVNEFAETVKTTLIEAIEVAKRKRQ